MLPPRPALPAPCHAGLREKPPRSSFPHARSCLAASRAPAPRAARALWRSMPVAIPLLDASSPPSHSLPAPPTHRATSAHSSRGPVGDAEGHRFSSLAPAPPLSPRVPPSPSSFSSLGRPSACTHGFHRLLWMLPGLTRARVWGPTSTPYRSLFLSPTPPAACVSLNDQLRDSESPRVRSAPSSSSPLWPLRSSPK